ncbi:alcohol dehydrogenase catalytic domain-containing protein [Nonomuraea sp. NPDC052129]|uniref:alcohol dehydrogenase catalytic domain-containing protein n=1 Tax=Nonomuraea sp. NPDC052129 TaxID=3154651 RepID=UPI0034411F7A
MSVPATMRALQQTSLNGPQDMRLITDAPVPSPGQGEVLIRVTATGVNFADISKAHGTFLDGPRAPYLAGFEAAGEVVAVGEAVTSPSPGARVVGVGDGAFAEYMVLPAAKRVTGRVVVYGLAGGFIAALNDEPGRGLDEGGEVLHDWVHWGEWGSLGASRSEAMVAPTGRGRRAGAPAARC